MLYLLFSTITFILSTFMFNRAAGSLSLMKPNMISYLYYFPVISMSFLAAIIVVIKIDDHYIISHVSDEARLYGWLAIMYTMLVFPIGLLISKYIWLGNVNVSYLLDNYTTSHISVSGVNGNALKYSIWIFTALSVVSCLYTFHIIGYFPLLKALTSPAQELVKLRIDSSLYFNGNLYIRNIMAFTLMPLLSYMWFFYYIESKNKIYGLFFLFTFFLSLSILYFDFSKAPVLWYLVSFIFAIFYANGKFKIITLLILCLSVILILIAMYIFNGASIKEVLSYNTGPIGRIILSQAAGTFYMLDIFPLKYDFIGLSSTSKLISNIF